MTQNIASTTMIVALELGLPRQAVQLKDEAAKIEKESHAEKGTVRASIHYFRKRKESSTGEVDGLEVLKDYHLEFKTKVHQLARYPYGGGFYLAPAAVVEQLLKLDEEFIVKKAAAWKKWSEEVYPLWSKDAPDRMGSLYSQADFPSLEDCAKRFRSHLTILPLAEKEQVDRIALISPKSQQLLKDHADETNKAAIAELHKQIWKDLMKPLEHVVTVFEKDKPKIYETLLGNLMEIVNVIPQYETLTNDMQLQSAADKIKAAFGKMSTEDLRTSKEHRDEALALAKNMVSQFKPFSRKFV